MKIMKSILLVFAVLLVASCASESDSSQMVQTFPALDGFELNITDPNPNIAWTPNAVTLVSEEVSENVFAIYDSNAPTYAPAGFPMATSGGFVIGENGVLLVETMWNRQLLFQVYNLVRAETDLPVLYAVNTNHHADHNFGNSFLPDEVKVVQHERTAEHMAAHFADEMAFSETNFGTDQGFDEATYREADIKVSDDGWSVDLGGITVEARYYGFGQSEGDLFVYVPESAVIWTGNSLTAEAPAIPWLLEGGAELAARTMADVQASLPDDAVVIPGHGRPVGRDGLSFTINYLNSLVDEVRTSRESGNDLEETQAAVTMPDFQGYAAWGFAHTMINVPMTYMQKAGH